MPSRQTVRLIKQKADVHDAAIEILKKQGYVTCHDVTDMLGMNLMTAANVLSKHSDEWGLGKGYATTTFHGYAGDWIKVYFEDSSKKPAEIEVSGFKFYNKK